MLAQGHRLGQYEVLELLGAGRMEEVYRASPGSARCRARGRGDGRAQVICGARQAVVPDDDLPMETPANDFRLGRPVRQFALMEHLEGETLAQRLVKGALPVIPRRACDADDALSFMLGRTGSRINMISCADRGFSRDSLGQRIAAIDLGLRLPRRPFS